MATEDFSGPVDYAVFTFPRDADVGAALAALLDRVDAGIVEILDLEVVGRDDDGAPLRLPLTELHGIEAPLARLDGVESSILERDDLEEIADALTEGWVALAVVYEDRSLATVASAVLASGGELLWSGGITIDDLEQALEAEAPEETR